MLEHRTFFEAEARGVVARRRTNEALRAAPERGAETHRARLARRVQLVRGHSVRGQGVGAQALLRHHDRDDLGVQSAVLETDNAVDADRDQRARVTFDDDGAEGASRPAPDVLRRKPDRETHAILVGEADREVLPGHLAHIVARCAPSWI